jgi:hypothetical protein
MEDVMSMKTLSAYSVAGLAGATMLALSWSPASAFTLSGPSLAPPIASAQIDNVYYRAPVRGGVHGVYRGGARVGYGYHGGYRRYGYGGAAVVGGAAVGAAVVAPHCWINAYGARVCN